jgi:MOSC domain-containing protein YiiM
VARSVVGVGNLERIWVKRGMRGPMDPAESAELVADHGIRGNADTGGRRQVTIISAERWARAEADLETTLDPSLRRANLLVTGVDLIGSRDKILTIGACRLRIGGETRPCRFMNEQHPGLQDALDADWGGGAYGVVLEGGAITVGDAVEFA